MRPNFAPSLRDDMQINVTTHTGKTVAASQQHLYTADVQIEDGRTQSDSTIQKEYTNEHVLIKGKPTRDSNFREKSLQIAQTKSAMQIFDEVNHGTAIQVKDTCSNVPPHRVAKHRLALLRNGKDPVSHVQIGPPVPLRRPAPCAGS